MRAFPIPVLISILAFGLASCGVVDRIRGKEGRAEISMPSSGRALPGTAAARSAEALDKASAADRAAALGSGENLAGRELGEVTVSLGSPAETGFWLRSALVSAPMKGRVVTDQGISVRVDLLPGQAGAQLSLSAFRTLGLPLTGLPRVTVFAE